MSAPLPWFLQEKQAKEIYLSNKASYLVLDFEADGMVGPVDPTGELVLACWKVVTPEGTVTKHLWGDEFGMEELLNDIRRVDFVVAQNAKYELQWLKRCGLELRDVLVWCTYLAQWVLDGNQTLPRGLGALAKRYQLPIHKIDLIGKLWAVGVTTKEIPPSWLLTYCQRDVDLAHQLFLKQRELVYRDNLQHLVFQRCITCACLADIEFNGMTLDPQRVAQELERVQTGINETSDRLRELSGGINLASPFQLGVFLYETLGFAQPKDRKGNFIRTASGRYPTDSNTLVTLKPQTVEQKEFLETYRKYNKLDALLTKNLTFFAGVCKHGTGTFRAVFNQGITQTHRLSSSGIPTLFPGEKKRKSVQFQNLPREYKKLFWSGDEDYFLGEADGSQLEFRVAADLGNDPVAWEEIATKVDIHSITAKALTDAGEPTTRQEAKARTFRPLYGGQSGTKAEVAYIQFFKDKYQGISQTQRGWALTVVNKKKLVTPYGMIFYWPDTTMDRSGYIKNTTSIYNYPVITSGFKQECLSNNSVNSGKVLVG